LLTGLHECTPKSPSRMVRTAAGRRAIGTSVQGVDAECGALDGLRHQRAELVGDPCQWESESQRKQDDPQRKSSPLGRRKRVPEILQALHIKSARVFGIDGVESVSPTEQAVDTCCHIPLGKDRRRRINAAEKSEWPRPKHGNRVALKLFDRRTDG